MAAMQQPEPEPEPVPMSRRQLVTSSSQQERERAATPPEEVPPPPLEELEPPPVAPVRASPGRPAAPGRRGGPPGKPAGTREPSVGADRYEDIIVEARKRSLSRGPNSRMGSRTSSTLDFRSSQAEFPSNGGSKVDINSVRSSIGASTRSVAGDLEMPKVPVQPSPPPKPKAAEVFQPSQTPPKSRCTPVQQPISPPKPIQAPMALDANSNATEPTLPVVPSKPAKSIEP